MSSTTIILTLLSFSIIGVLIYLLISNAKKKENSQKLRLKKRPFRDEWKAILRESVTFYNEIPDSKKEEFEQRILRFLDTITITPIATEIEDLDRLLVASSAIIPIFGYPNWEYPNLNEVIILESDLNDTEFGQQFTDGHVLGMVGEGKLKNKMLLSKGALREGFRNDNDKKNVGIHEFVHLIDMADGKTDGIPEVLLQKSYTIPWMKLMQEETEKIINKESSIDEYGATKVQEFITVTSEYFFERPQLLEKKHPELYNALEKIFNQDMAEQERNYLNNLVEEKEIGRNDPCPCGSGKKYKKCHGKFE
ncbi:M90 family metallopeptidase [Flammeovirga sp. EKP202]|uniref:M90 family metallopeptidase n=1 Tax=Flammeovirga sp. EKP202 TaxID=2770592 RepID=UPI00165ED67B|nr:M90 family metallopeptidase [Flammeovirga sp. EKP202]MBD0403522.1 zinc-dependent peptidase [Flammeovirga sp. EKP202]